MVSRPLVAVIIVNYNGFELTSECLRSLSRSSYGPLLIVIVDNASTDGSPGKLRASHPEAELLELDVNGGYSHGNNVGMAHAFNRGAQYVFIINNDTVIDPRCIEYLEQTLAANAEIGVLGPKVLSFDRPETIMNAGITGDISRARYEWIGLDEKDAGQYEGLVDVLFQDGCAILLSRACYEKTGGFDESLWAYYEDSDLCLRAQRAGFRVCCCQKAKVWHRQSATFGTQHERVPHGVYYTIRNSYIFHRRYAGSPLKRLRAAATLLSRTPRIFGSILFKGRSFKWKNLRVLVAATAVGLTTNAGHPGDAFAPVKAVRRNRREEALHLPRNTGKADPARQGEETPR